MKLLVLCVLAMMVTMAVSHLTRQFEVALKVQIIAGFDKKLATWINRHGSGLSAIQKKTLYFVNRRYMQTYWQNYMLFVDEKIRKLGRAPNVNDYTAIGAEIGRRVPLQITIYPIMIKYHILPKWRPYMGKILALRVEDIPVDYY
uniref:Egg-lysin n=3 Tax=Haliotis tuberculata TaxID=36103 RepID=Q25173_HALTU|nr:sperm lysin [Haliotis tuberculata lamellosa]